MKLEQPDDFDDDLGVPLLNVELEPLAATKNEDAVNTGDANPPQISLPDAIGPQQFETQS